MSHGLLNGSAVKGGSVAGTVERNVFVGGATIDGSKRGYVAEFGNAAGTVLRDNLAAHDSQRWDAPFLINPCRNVTGTPASVNLSALLGDAAGTPPARERSSSTMRPCSAAFSFTSVGGQVSF